MLHISRILETRRNQLRVSRNIEEEEITRVLLSLFPQPPPSFFVRNNTLFLTFKNSAHSGNIYFEKSELLSKLQRVLQFSKISRIQIRS